MKFLTVDDVQEILHINKNNAYALFHKNNFPAIRIGRKLLVEESKLEDYLNKYIGSEILL